MVSVSFLPSPARFAFGETGRRDLNSRPSMGSRPVSGFGVKDKRARSPWKPIIGFDPVDDRTAPTVEESSPRRDRLWRPRRP
jgi:hypothetical protein